MVPSLNSRIGTRQLQGLATRKAQRDRHECDEDHVGVRSNSQAQGRENAVLIDGDDSITT